MQEIEKQGMSRELTVDLGWGRTTGEDQERESTREREREIER